MIERPVFKHKDKYIFDRGDGNALRLDHPWDKLYFYISTIEVRAGNLTGGRVVVVPINMAEVRGENN